MNKFDIVLDDNLYKIYHHFKNGGSKTKNSISIDTISKIFKFSGNSVLTNIAQIDRLNLEISDPLKSNLLHQKTKKHPLVELSKCTNYKVILTDDKGKTQFPYVNITNDQIEMVMGGFIMREQNRDKAISHIKSLCACSRDIIIYDKYFSAASNENNNIETLKSLLPTDRKINITYHKDTSGNCHISSSGLSKLNNDVPNWTIQDKMLKDHHDRYLIVDNEIEIILTSGFDYLSNMGKEISYIIRNYNNRF